MTIIPQFEKNPNVNSEVILGNSFIRNHISTANVGSEDNEFISSVYERMNSDFSEIDVESSVNIQVGNPKKNGVSIAFVK